MMQTTILAQTSLEKIPQRIKRHWGWTWRRGGSEGNSSFQGVVKFHSVRVFLDDSMEQEFTMGEVKAKKSGGRGSSEESKKEDNSGEKEGGPPIPPWNG